MKDKGIENDINDNSSETSDSPDIEIMEDEIEKYEQDDNQYNMDNYRIFEENISNNKFDTVYELISFENYLAEEIKDEILKYSPIELFLYFLDKFAESAANFSNKFAYKRYSENIKFSKGDILQYLLIYIFLSIYNYLEIFIVWENNSIIKNQISQIIPKNKYIKINNYYYISDYSDNITPDINLNNKTEKINFVIEYFNKKWKELICKYLTIDESMCSYKGKIIFRQNMKDKHLKFGMKFFTKSSSDNGYVYHILPYSGKSFKYNKNIGIGPLLL